MHLSTGIRKVGLLLRQGRKQIAYIRDVHLSSMGLIFDDEITLALQDLFCVLSIDRHIVVALLLLLSAFCLLPQTLFLKELSLQSILDQIQICRSSEQGRNKMLVYEWQHLRLFENNPSQVLFLVLVDRFGQHIDVPP